MDIREDMDNHYIDRITSSIFDGDHEKVFIYLDLLYDFYKLKSCVTLCQRMNALDLSQKVAKYIAEKE